MPNIRFLSNLENDEMSRWVSFPALVDDKEVECVITHDTLNNHFNAGYRDYISSAISNIEDICELAKKLIIEGRFEDGRIVIKSRDMTDFLNK
jgi:hypothetical protein